MTKEADTARVLLVIVTEMQAMLRHARNMEAVVIALAERSGVRVAPLQDDA